MARTLSSSAGFGSPGKRAKDKMKVVISKSSKAGKKYEAVVGDKTIAFGASGYEDFTTHGDEERKQRYLARHRKTEELCWHKGKRSRVFSLYPEL